MKPIRQLTLVALLALALGLSACQAFESRVEAAQTESAPGPATPRAVTDSGLQRIVVMSPSGESYIDPEILPGGALMAYQSEGNVYLAALDPLTGLFVHPDGKDTLVDSAAARPLATFNGPEFGIDAGGWALYYASDADEGIQTWRASLEAGGQPQTTRISSGEPHLSQLASRDPLAESVRLAAIRGSWEAGTIVWYDEAEPGIEHEISPIENGVASLRWVDDSRSLTYSLREGADRGQIVLLDTDSGVQQRITADAGDKTDPYGWFAPEYGGELLVLAIVDNAAVAIYRNMGGEFWERIATLHPPAASQFDFVSSAEPFTLGGRSYISLVIKDASSNRERFTDSEVWLLDLTEDPAARYTERCDSGESGIARSDPEVFVGEERVFVYYNVISGGDQPYELRRCASNLGADGLPLSEPVDILAFDPAPSSAEPAPEFCQWVTPQATDPAIDMALEPHYVCRDGSVTMRASLLIFFPGTGALPADYQLFVQEAASMGLHAIGLTYPNEKSFNLQTCRFALDPDCQEKGREEVITGQDLHGETAVNETNSIYNRVTQLLRYLDQAEPEAGWGQYLAGDAPAWDHIIVAGHSQGGGMAAYVAHLNTVERGIFFAWTDLVRGRAAPWILEPHATPGERLYVFEHLDDRERGKVARAEMVAAFGIDQFGESSIDGNTPPYGEAHVLVTLIEPALQGPNEYAGAHNVVVVDGYTPLLDGQPLLRDTWRYLLGE